MEHGHFLNSTGILSDRDVRHSHFLKSTCDIRTPRQGPHPCLLSRWRGSNSPRHGGCLPRHPTPHTLTPTTGGIRALLGVLPRPGDLTPMVHLVARLQIYRPWGRSRGSANIHKKIFEFEKLVIPARFFPCFL